MTFEGVGVVELGVYRSGLLDRSCCESKDFDLNL